MPGIAHLAPLTVQQNKIVGYLLDLHHPQGGSKARFFTAFGFDQQDWPIFASALQQHGMTQQLQSETPTAFGPTYEVACSIVTPDGRNPCIISVWIAEPSTHPRLVTAYPA
ncbi:MAG: hypothetical protein JWQ90_3768 [Hydrocarboniphaga sp.]|uniref:DUF6883 domain-containing protein n=1 Tax=Hydrocarboniphaga sp. TaxID=2033016 RepID=UPI00262C169F|nr:DUF6883 domain-containing protein [Hydrocarboniphaga sp.]MDB5971318.1 hypothetical protein [Hydrocarboniphaga sp.]